MTSQGMNCSGGVRDGLGGREGGGGYEAGVELGLDARVLRAEGVDDAAEAEVDAAGEEGGADGQAADLHEEAVLGPGVEGAHDAAGVAEDLEDGAGDEGKGEAEAAAGDGVGADEAEEGEAEEGEEGGVGGHGHFVLVEAADAVAPLVVGVLEAKVGPAGVAVRRGDAFGHGGGGGGWSGGKMRKGRIKGKGVKPS